MPNTLLKVSSERNATLDEKCDSDNECYHSIFLIFHIYKTQGLDLALLYIS